MRLSKLSSLCIAAVATTISFTAAAVDGTITFKGAITDTTCSVGVNGGASVADVILPTVSASAFAVKDDIAARTRFTIDLTNCSVGTEARAHFDDSLTHVNADGNLLNGHEVGNVAGHAQGVGFALFDLSGSRIQIGSSSPQAGAGAHWATIAANGGARIPYDVAYVAFEPRANIAPGTVESSVGFTVEYR